MQVFLPSPLAVSLCLPACDHLRLEHTASLTTLHIRANNTPVACWRVKAIHGLSPPVHQGALYTTDGENKVICSWSKTSSAPEPRQSRATVGRVVTWKGWAAQAGRDQPPLGTLSGLLHCVQIRTHYLKVVRCLLRDVLEPQCISRPTHRGVCPARDLVVSGSSVRMFTFQY